MDTNDVGLFNPTGLAYSFEANLFYVLEAHSITQANIAMLTPFEELVALVSIDVSTIDPINLVFDGFFNRLLLLDTASGEVVAIKVGPDGRLDPSPQTITRFQIGQLGLQQPRGIAIDPANGHLFILDSATLQIVRVGPDAEGDLDGAAALGEGRVSRLDVGQSGLVDARGLAINPNNGHLYLLSRVEQSVIELNQTGQVVAVLPLPPSEFINPQGLVFARSGDATDDPSIIDIYIADSGLREEKPAVQAPGRIIELSTRIVYVPGDAPTVQAGINLARDRDLVLVAPGVYRENIELSGKTITLASQYLTTQNPDFIDQTILDGNGNTVVTVAPSVGPETRIIGFTIRNGDDGISASARLHILNNRFIGNKDAIDYEAGGGLCRNNVFEHNSDDAIDLDGPTEVTIEGNTIHDSNDDGIEIRLHKYSGPTLNIIIRNNTIIDSWEDGIQLVDYPDVSDRVFLIERNLIADSNKVGLGLMDNGDSKEDFRGAGIPERIHVINNTFIDNYYGLTGGDNLIALNNIFVGSSAVALKNVGGDSIAAYNLFWRNGTNFQNSVVDMATTVFEAPGLDDRYWLLPGSPAIDAGAASFSWNSEVVLNIQPNVYAGVAPDLGAYEACRLYVPIIWNQQ